MIPDRAADRHPPLPASAKGSARNARAIGDVDDAPTPAKAVVLNESSDLSELRGQLQALTIAVRDLRDEMRLARVAKSERAAAPVIGRTRSASLSMAKILRSVARLVLVLAVAATVAAALMLLLAGPAFSGEGVPYAWDLKLFSLA